MPIKYYLLKRRLVSFKQSLPVFHTNRSIGKPHTVFLEKVVFLWTIAIFNIIFLILVKTSITFFPLTQTRWESTCQWPHCASVQEYDMTLKPVHLISDLTNYDIEQVKPTNEMKKVERYWSQSCVMCYHVLKSEDHRGSFPICTNICLTLTARTANKAFPRQHFPCEV